MHVDEFIEDPFIEESYAQWVLMHFRLSASMQMQFKEHMKDNLLFCKWTGKRYRVVGASRFGDVWLAADFEREFGYDHRVNIEDCFNWGDQP